MKIDVDKTANSLILMLLTLQIPKDWVLFVIVVIVVAVDLLIILIGTAIPSSRLRATLIEDVQHPSSIVSKHCWIIITPHRICLSRRHSQ